MKSPDNPDHHTVTESLAITVGDYFPVGDRMRLVVSAATGEVGTGDSSWAPPQRLACWTRWGEKWANG